MGFAIPQLRAMGCAGGLEPIRLSRVEGKIPLGRGIEAGIALPATLLGWGKAGQREKVVAGKRTAEGLAPLTTIEFLGQAVTPPSPHKMWRN